MSVTAAAPAVTVTDVRTSEDDAEVQAILHDHVEWVALAAGLDLRQAQPGLIPELSDDPDRRCGPTMRFLARRHGTAVGIVTIAVQGDGSAELKRMFVRPVARGHGVADALLVTALDRAAAVGCRTVWLETLRGAMDRAIAVYRRHGFVESARRGSLHGTPGIVVLEREVGVEGGCRPGGG